jgi:nitrate reductase cytochrome c-type subunit
MKKILVVLFVVSLCSLLLSPPVGAEEMAVPSEREVSQAEGMPPLMPHALPEPGRNGFFPCLVCHGDAKQGAPQTPHPDRLTCTQCHVQGEITAKSAVKKK